MKTTAVKLILITAFALVLRLALLSFVHNPGLHDPVHYYNLGRRLSEGHGFTIDYIWHYARMPVELPNDIDHWMPLPGVAVALGMIIGGANVYAAVAPFVLVGSLVPALVFVAARLLRQTATCALTAALFAAVLPEFVLNSLRTDTTILNMAFVMSALLLLYQTLEHDRKIGLLLSGLLFGLAHLTRNDSVIFFGLLVAYLLLGGVIGGKRARRSDVLIVVLVYLITIAPWHFRNLQVVGSLGSPQMSRMPFMVAPRDLYAYGVPITFETLLERQSLWQLIGKRLFELGAALKQMAVSLQLPLALLVPAGIYCAIARRDRNQLRLLLPVMTWILGLLIVYPILMPVHNQGGSFMKAFLTLMPLLIPFGAIALDKYVRRREWRVAIVLLSLCWLLWSSYDLVRHSTLKADAFYASIQIMLDRLANLPDRTGDGEYRLMSQDPYVLSVFGYSSVVTPLASREDTLALAQRFEIDYLQMPAARPALDALYLGEEIDPRFELAAHIADAGEIPFELYSFVHDGQQKS